MISTVCPRLGVVVDLIRRVRVDGPLPAVVAGPAQRAGAVTGWPVGSELPKVRQAAPGRRYERHAAVLARQAGGHRTARRLQARLVWEPEGGGDVGDRD